MWTFIIQYQKFAINKLASDSNSRFFPISFPVLLVLISEKFWIISIQFLVIYQFAKTVN